MRRCLYRLPAGLLLLAPPAVAHESIVPHAHPHTSVAWQALLGYDTLAVIVLATAVAIALAVVLARRRR